MSEIDLCHCSCRSAQALKSRKFVFLYSCLKVDRAVCGTLGWWVEEEVQKAGKMEEIAKKSNGPEECPSLYKTKGKRMPNPEVILFEDLMNRRYV
jgi:hypothetical protein